MKLKNLFLIFLAISSMIACKKKSDEQRTMFAAPKDTVLAKLRETPQGFTIDATKDTILTGKSGIKVAIGANVFVDEDGNPVNNVQIELLEAVNVQSFIENDLATVSGDEILESGGMFYINATSNGKPVSIKNNEALTLSVPSSAVIGDMGVFYGTYNNEGKLEWQPVKNEENMAMDFNMIALPLKTLDYKGQADKLRQSWFQNDTLVINEIEKLADPKFEGTFIATREFATRLQIHILGVMTNSDRTTFRDVMNIYKKHINGNLWEADEEVYKYLTPHYNELVKRMDNDSDDQLQFAKAFKDFVSRCWAVVETAPKAKCTQPVNFAKLGITDNTTKQQLVDKGISPAQADRYLYMYNQYKSETTFAAIKSYTVSVSKLGWVNIDRFLNDPSCKESKLSVTVTGVDTNMVKLVLVFPMRNICVEALNHTGNTYSFTNKGGNYRKLPIGEEAVLIAMSSKNGQPYFATQNIQISETGAYTMELQQSSTEEMKTAMGRALKMKKPL